MSEEWGQSPRPQNSQIGILDWRIVGILTRTPHATHVPSTSVNASGEQLSARAGGAEAAPGASSRVRSDAAGMVDAPAASAPAAARAASSTCTH